MENEQKNSIVADPGFNYSPPKIELLEIVVEKGFADSTTDFEPDTW